MSMEEYMQGAVEQKILRSRRFTPNDPASDEKLHNHQSLSGTLLYLRQAVIP